ncbi:MAG: hypothetical protein ACI4KA_07680 [Oscillospiraceae bacterium]
MAKKDSPLSTYAVVSQLSFSIICPLLIFIVGGYFAGEHFGWPDWSMAVCVALGILFMICGGVSYLRKLIRIYGKDNKASPKSFSTGEDNDYYDDYK